MTAFSFLTKKLNVFLRQTEIFSRVQFLVRDSGFVLNTVWQKEAFFVMVCYETKR